MAWFRAFRGEFGYSHYGDNRTSVHADTQFVAIIYACVLISLAAIIAATGIRGRERWYTLIRVTYSLAVGSVILVSIYGYCWQMGDVGVSSSYIYRNKGHVDGSIGVRVGLKHVNLTLSGVFDSDGSRLNYNEELVLEDVLKSPKSLHDALDRGLPQPLLSIIEHFDIDKGGLRFGRASFLAGHFAHILLWSAFAFWVTANILFVSVIWYGTACFTLTGICMVLAAVVYDYLCPQTLVRLPCADDLLSLKYGWCFWASLVFGIVTTVIGLVLFALEHKFPKKLAEFFMLDNPLCEDDCKNPNVQLFPPYSHYSTPSSQDRPRSRNSIGDNWYVNYAFDNTSQKTNPVYSENAHDSSGNNSMLDSPRPRSCSNIEEEEIPSHQDENQATSLDSSAKHEHEEDRLKNIYVDVQPPAELQIPSTTADSYNIEMEER